MDEHERVAGGARVQGPGEVTTALPSTPEAVAQARMVIRTSCGSLPDALRDDAELLVSELVSNAVRHGGGHVQLRVLVNERDLTVSVYDDGDGEPVVSQRFLGPEVASGRGLQLVEKLADGWGVFPAEGGGKTVWILLTTASAGRRGHDTKGASQ